MSVSQIPPGQGGGRSILAFIMGDPGRKVKYEIFGASVFLVFTAKTLYLFQPCPAAGEHFFYADAGFHPAPRRGFAPNPTGGNDFPQTPSLMGG